MKFSFLFKKSRKIKLSFKEVVRILLLSGGESLNQELLEYFLYNSNLLTTSAFLSENSDNGLYTSIGGGFEYEKFDLNLMYTINRAKISDSNSSSNEKYKRFVLSIGYKFYL